MHVKVKLLQILIFTFIFVLSFSSCKKQTEKIPEIQDKPIPKICSPIVTAYDFGLEQYTPSQQVRILDSLGLDGIFVSISRYSDEKELIEYLQASELTDSFEVYDALAYVSLTDTVLKKKQLATIESVYKEIQFRPTQLQVIFLGPDEDPTNVIVEVADIASKYNKNLIIYPHYETSKIASAEEALTYIQTVQKSNVFLAVHLCHELAAGNANRMDEVVAAVSPYIKMVSMSGATIAEFSNAALPNWYWGIKPLYMGDYNLQYFYKALYNNNYEGPIAIQTWGIFNNFSLTPEEHLPLSKNVIEQQAAEACR